MEAVLSDSDWESVHAPYDQPTYQAVLDQMCPSDNVLDIGAGDLRLALQMAPIVRKVYAIEINPRVLDRAHAMHNPLPRNVVTICADARTLDFPTDITTGVLLMRHCTCFPLYLHKLRESGAVRLITNARWRMDVEVVNLVTQPPCFAALDMGWYACQCGRTGFKEGPAEHWSLEMDQRINEVSNCPQCRYE
jgi:hypothetical protein